MQPCQLLRQAITVWRNPGTCCYDVSLMFTTALKIASKPCIQILEIEHNQGKCTLFYYCFDHYRMLAFKIAEPYLVNWCVDNCVDKIAEIYIRLWIHHLVKTNLKGRLEMVLILSQCRCVRLTHGVISKPKSRRLEGDLHGRSPSHIFEV